MVTKPNKNDVSSRASFSDSEFIVVAYEWSACSVTMIVALICYMLLVFVFLNSPWHGEAPNIADHGPVSYVKMIVLHTIVLPHDQPKHA
jgi:hypothetical protein